MVKGNKEQAITEPANGAVDKIRDLLFGQQMDGYEQNFQRLETMIFSHVKQATDEMNSRLIAVENAIDKRVETTQLALKIEQEERIQAIDAINTRMQQNYQQLSSQLHALENDSTGNLKDIKVTLEQQNQSLGSQLQALREQFNLSLNDQAARLDKQTIKRQKLAGLLSEISSQLKS